MKFNDKIMRATGFFIAVVVIVAVVLMVFWRTGGPGTATSSQAGHQTGSDGAVLDLNGGRSDSAKVGVGEGKRLSNKSPQLIDHAKSNSAPPPAVRIQAFGINGELTTKAIENLDLTSAEVVALTDLLTTIKEQAAADFVTRTRITENLPGPNGGFRHTYFVKARPDRGQEFSVALASGCEAVIGAARTQMINPNISSLDFLGGAGKYDLNIVVSSDGGEKVVKYEMIDPKSGSVLETHDCGYETFADAFGNVFAY